MCPECGLSFALLNVQLVHVAQKCMAFDYAGSLGHNQTRRPSPSVRRRRLDARRELVGQLVRVVDRDTPRERRRAVVVGDGHPPVTRLILRVGECHTTDYRGRCRCVAMSVATVANDPAPIKMTLRHPDPFPSAGPLSGLAEIDAAASAVNVDATCTWS